MFTKILKVPTLLKKDHLLSKRQRSILSSQGFRNNKEMLKMITMNSRFSLCLMLLFKIFFGEIIAQNNIPKPLDRNDGWKVGTLADAGILVDSMNALIGKIRDVQPPDFRSLIIAREGKLVYEGYFNSWLSTNVADVRSAGKSFTATMALIALDKGLINLEDPVVDYFKSYQPIKFATEKAKIKVKHLLTMSSGLDADVDNMDSPGNEDNVVQSDDYIKYILNLPMAFEPGSQYVYNSATAMLMAAVVEEASGKTMQAFADEHLFHPLQFGDYLWQRTPKGRTNGAGNLYLRGRDMAKLGQLYLQKGTWNDQQFISAALIEDATQPHLEITNYYAAQHYGYMWYTNRVEVRGRTLDYYFASGNGGNKIFVVPELALVIATLQTAYGQGYGHGRADRIFEMVVQWCE